MKLRSIAIALAFCVSLLSTSYAQQIPKARQQRLIALAKQLHLTRTQAKRLYSHIAFVCGRRVSRA